MKAKWKLMLVLLASLALLAACGKSQEGEAAAAVSAYVNAEPTDGSIQIDTSAVTESASYINYDSNGSTVQLIAVRGSDGQVRLSFNTCQACTPSPKAYFIQDGDQFICQNCLNAFAADQLGMQRGGCNPLPVDEQSQEGSIISIPTAYLDQFSANFANWQGPTE